MVTGWRVPGKSAISPQERLSDRGSWRVAGREERMIQSSGEADIPAAAGAVSAESSGGAFAVSGDTRRPSAERRLIAAVTRAAAQHGYAGLTVERVLVEGAVSRATFYQYFTSLDDCFWSAYREQAAWLLTEVSLAARGAHDREAAVLGALIDAMTSRPDAAWMLAGESVAAGPAGLRERDYLVAALVSVLTRETARPSVDLPATTLIGATLGYLAMRLADRPSAAELREEVLEWAGAFAAEASAEAWAPRFTPPAQAPARSVAVPAGPLSRGSSRERIVRATMLVVRERGFRAATVADIVAAAHLSRRHFYNEFPSKPAAFIAAYELGFQRTLEACTPAFFSPGDWPQRVWNSASAFTGFLAREPLIAHLGFVECYAVGREYVPRLHDTQLAFTLFLEEGFRQRPEAEALSRSCAALTAAAVFDLAFEACRRGPGEHLRRVQPLSVFVALAPFLGVSEAGRFVSMKRDAGAVSRRTVA
jgi:AcrR family transcriptional regulator